MTTLISPKNMYPITCDEQQKTISVRNSIFYKPFLRFAFSKYHNDQVRHALIKRSGIVFPENCYNKQRNEFYALHLGSKFNDRFRRVNYKVWVSPYECEIKRFCYIGRSLADNLVYQFHGAAGIINEALNDKLDHLVPVILATNKTPSDLKKLLGKSIWKRICKNSLSRNKLLINNIFSMCQRLYGFNINWITTSSKPEYMDFNDDNIDHLNQMLCWPSTLLAQYLPQ